MEWNRKRYCKRRKKLAINKKHLRRWSSKSRSGKKIRYFNTLLLVVLIFCYKVCANLMLRESFCQWPYLAKKGFPLIFHGVQGRDEREANSVRFKRKSVEITICHFQLIEWLIRFPGRALNNLSSFLLITNHYLIEYSFSLRGLTNLRRFRSPITARSSRSIAPPGLPITI